MTAKLDIPGSFGASYKLFRTLGDRTTGFDGSDEGRGIGAAHEQRLQDGVWSTPQEIVGSRYRD
jgi:hypothetical protein